LLRCCPRCQSPEPRRTCPGLEADFFQIAQQDQHDPSSGGLKSAQRTADIKRFAGDYGLDGVTFEHAERVHHPGHDLTVSVHVWGGDIALRPYDGQYLRHIASCHAGQFAGGQLRGVDPDAAFGAAIRNIYYGTFERHPGGQSFDFIRVHVRMIADSSLGRPARGGMLDAVSFKHPD
jgi:hypothetical protein